MSHATSQEQDPANQPIQNTSKQSKRKSPARKATSEKEKPPAASEKELRALASKAEKISEHDLSIAKAQASSMAKALAAGELLLWAKQELKRLGLKRTFQEWIDLECKIAY